MKNGEQKSFYREGLETLSQQNRRLTGEAALINHFTHRQHLELRICKEVFKGKYTVLPSKDYTDKDLNED